MSTPLQSTHTTGELTFLGSRVRVLATGDDTGGSLGLLDMIEVPAGDMPPLHLHRHEDEGFYVISGELSVFLPGRRIDLGPGEYAVAPRGVPHAYRVGDAPARLLVTSTPAGFERFVADVAGRENAGPETLTAVAAQYDIEILGPPGMLP
jgi:quercetin dioxygenase-like cupin family protein